MITATRPSLLLPYSELMNDVVERLRPAIVTVHDGRRGSGSGVVWAENLIITNHHVVPGGAARIIFADGRPATGQVVARDAGNDIVALQVEDAPEPAPIGDSMALRIGHLVMAIGHPLGVENAVTTGIVSGLPTAADPRALIRSDLHLNPGNSGGPLIAADGTVVGINSMVAGPGTGLSVPAYTVQAFMARATGQTPHLGLELTAVLLPPNFRDSLGGAIETGLLVTAIEPGSAADLAGVFPGDILIGVDNRDARHPLRLAEALAQAARGQRLILHLIRGGRPHQIVVGA